MEIPLRLLHTGCGFAERLQNGLEPLANVFKAVLLCSGDQCGIGTALAPKPLRKQDGFECANRSIELIVHQNIVVFPVILNLATGFIQPLLNLLLRILAALAQALFELETVGWKNENAYGIRDLALDLGRALHIDVKQ